MIRINLLPQRRAKRIAANDAGGRDLLIGGLALAAAAVVGFLAFDQPKRGKLHDLRAANDQLQQEINAKNAQLAGYPKLKLAADEAKQRERSIRRLIAAKVVPANVLHELGEILTPNHLPTMTAEMATRTGNSPASDPNRRFDLAWDPTHVWLTAFTDTSGGFRLEGGAQGENDITQLSKRLQASAYFDDISQSSEQRVVNKDSGVAYYNFTITGKVAY